MSACDCLNIDREFQQLLSPLSDEERAALEESIASHGCLSPLVVWNDTLIDGHNRYEICTRLGKPFDVRRLDLLDRKAAYNWIIDNQLSRRNVTPTMAAYLRGKRYLVEKQSVGGQPRRVGQNVPPANEDDRTSAKVAAHFGVDEKTVRRDAEFAKALDEAPEDTRKAVLSGKVTTTKREVIEAAKSGDFSTLAPSPKRSAVATSPKPKRQQPGPLCKLLNQITDIAHSGRKDERTARSALKKILAMARDALGDDI